jgi:hypothetical protein
MFGTSASHRAQHAWRSAPAIARSFFSCALPALGLLAGLAPHRGWACACGCGVFEVGTASMLPTGAGGTTWLEWDYQDQSNNWDGTGKALAADNGDKNLTTNFFTAGLQYMFDRSWGIQAEIPYWDRSFTTDVNFPTPPMDDVKAHWSDVGDIRIKGIYTGFSPDLSSGITFGVKLPTGSYQFDSAVVDRDSQIGSGSTDLLLGGYHRGNLTQDNLWSWFVQTQFDQPVLTVENYRPGSELDTALGAHYNGWTFGNLTIAPIAQTILSLRTRDSGAAAAIPLASGFQRLFLSPGFEVDYKQVSFYADAEVPVYQHFTGDQLSAPVLLKVIVAFNF